MRHPSNQRLYPILSFIRSSHERRKERKREIAENESLPLKQLRERSLELPKIPDFVQMGRGNFTKMGKVKGGEGKGMERFGQIG